MEVGFVWALDWRHEYAKPFVHFLSNISVSADLSFKERECWSPFTKLIPLLNLALYKWPKWNSLLRIQSERQSWAIYSLVFAVHISAFIFCESISQVCLGTRSWSQEVSDAHAVLSASFFVGLSQHSHLVDDHTGILTRTNTNTECTSPGEQTRGPWPPARALWSWDDYHLI